MHVILVGLNHRTAAVDIREQMALEGCALRLGLGELAVVRRRPAIGSDAGPQKPYLSEAVILSTCNRLEVYAIVHGQPGEGWQAIEHFLSGLQGVPLEQLRPHLYYLEGHEVVVHLTRVATGLDSMILGEPQILGQVSAALTEAQNAGTAGPLLSHLFDQATHAGKRARAETAIGRYTTSVSHAAARLVADKVHDLSRVDVLVIGAGEMAELAAQALVAHGARRLSFVNRTFSRAQRMARQFSGLAFNWYHLPEALSAADVVVTATGAPHIIIHEDDVGQVLPARGGRPLIFVDIAVPRDVEQQVGRLPGVSRYDIDHLQSAVDANLAQRQAAVPEVEAIIDEEAQRFALWLQGRQVLPVLVELRRRASEIAEEELERNFHRLEEAQPVCHEMVAQVVHRVVNKLLHEPTVRLKASAAEGNGVEYAHVLRELFNLQAHPTAAVPRLESRGRRNGRTAHPDIGD
jgi:glutamyl-tRNA reductase